LEEHDLFALAATYAQGVPVGRRTLESHANRMKSKVIFWRVLFEGGLSGD